jgi:hypothetical protein
LFCRVDFAFGQREVGVGTAIADDKDLVAKANGGKAVTVNIKATGRVVLKLVEGAER